MKALILPLLLGLLVAYDWSFSRDSLNGDDFVTSFDKATPNQNDVSYHLDRLTANPEQFKAAMTYYHLAILVTDKEIKDKQQRLALKKQLDRKRQDVIDSYRYSDNDLTTYDEVLKYVASAITADEERYNHWYQIQLAGQKDVHQRIVKVNDMHASYTFCHLGAYC